MLQTQFSSCSYETTNWNSRALDISIKNYSFLERKENKRVSDRSSRLQLIDNTVPENGTLRNDYTMGEWNKFLKQY